MIFGKRNKKKWIYNMYSLIEMLGYKRPEGTATQREFCERFLEPIFGLPDIHGNYIHIIGDKPRLCFTAHHDTVHRTEGLQKLVVANDVVSVADATVSNCLGADCTTGIYIMLNMIEAGTEGVYVVHAAEEIGCKGSSALVNDYVYKGKFKWLEHIDSVISFDRYGDKSVITHQMGLRTASDDFAKSFADALDMPQLIGDNGGSYTDSNEYMTIVPECTNISVGYYNQHTKNETQDLVYLDYLVDSLINADWSKLVISRDPTVVDDMYEYNRGWSSTYGRSSAVEDIRTILTSYPDKVAELMDSYGWTAESIVEELGLDNQSDYYSYLDDYAKRRYM